MKILIVDHNDVVNDINGVSSIPGIPTETIATVDIMAVRQGDDIHVVKNREEAPRTIKVKKFAIDYLS